MKRRMLSILRWAVWIGLTASVAGWIYSERVPSPPFDPVTGQAPRLPACRVRFPIPADADEYLAPIQGRIEQWESTPWDGKFYRYDSGIHFVWPTGGFAIAAAWCGWWGFRRPYQKTIQMKVG